MSLRVPKEDTMEQISEAQVTALRASVAVMEAHEWCEGDLSRIGIYVLRPDTDGEVRPHILGATSFEGVGGALRQWREEGEIDDSTRIGILDGYGEYGWLVNPYAKGAA
jgi:hypothetical protein